jgi:hypothetical protein
MGVIATAGDVLRAGRLPEAAPSARDDEGPQPVAFMRTGNRGAVLFVRRTAPGEWMAIVALLERAADAWDEIAIMHKPWWDPAEPFEEDELIVTAGHSRFAAGPGPDVALVAGQAAAQTSIAGAGGDVAVHPPSGHFIYLAEIANHDEPVILTARRAGVEETSVFEPLDIR